MKKHEKRLELLKRLAEDHDGTAGAKVVAALDYKGNLYFGFNSEKTHPFQKKFAKKPEAIFLHAEIDAIRNGLKYLTIDQVSKSTLYIARVKRPHHKSKDYVAGHAKPCSGCAACITKFAIKKVYYTVDHV